MHTDHKFIPRTELAVAHHTVGVDKHPVTAARILDPDGRVVQDQSRVVPRHIRVSDYHFTVLIPPQRQTVATHRIASAVQRAIDGNKYRLTIHGVPVLRPKYQRPYARMDSVSSVYTSDHKAYHPLSATKGIVDTQSEALIGSTRSWRGTPPTLKSVHVVDDKGIRMADDTTGRLEQIQAELATVLEERLGVLSDALANSERTTRRIIAAEVELERNLQAREALQREVGELDTQVKDARHRCEEARQQNAKLSAERDTLRQNEQKLDKGLEQVRSEVAAAQRRVEGLEKEADGLRNENTALRTKLKTLEENLTRMRQLKDELMSSISGLTQQMSGLAGGDPE